MKITVIGWYGTETIGDRAILAGLFSFFNKTFQDFEIYLGSLYPFFSARTFDEDHTFWTEITGKDIRIKIFDSKNKQDLDHHIAMSDLICMGGGPLMDLNELFMVVYAFKKARKLGKKTALLGCGVGPLFQATYKKTVVEIVKNSDIVILRDVTSKDNLFEVARELNRNMKDRNISSSLDPAVECVTQYRCSNKKVKNDYIAVNLREFPGEYRNSSTYKDINDALKNLVSDLADTYRDRSIKLVPMHYFHVGNDDRVFLNRIGSELNKKNIEVQNSHLSLKKTIAVFQNAYFNVGMRFHSVLIQTIISGNNFILDYTEPKKGKISGFLKDVDQNNFYKSRYISLQDDEITTNIFHQEDDTFSLDEKLIKNKMKIYVDKLNETMTLP
jgi:polysaccharide pyruvyl transferase WcaK-like protein